MVHPYGEGCEKLKRVQTKMTKSKNGLWPEIELAPSSGTKTEKHDKGEKRKHPFAGQGQLLQKS